VGYSDPREPHARALRDYFEGDTSAAIVLHSSLGEHEEIPVAVFFRGPDEFFSFDRAALELCRGRILDVGAGTGLGLDITYRTVKQHKGTIEFHSKPGETRFIVRVPIEAKL